MTRLTQLALAGATAMLALATPVMAQSQADEARFAQAQQRLRSELATFQAEFDRYQRARAERGVYRDDRRGDPRYDDQRYDDRRYSDERDEGNYDAARYYRDGPNYRERVLANDDRVYRGNDGRYYCRRNDGTTGLIIGALGGGILGNVIDGGRSRTVGTLLGGVLGGVAGRAVEQNNAQVRCR